MLAHVGGSVLSGVTIGGLLGLLSQLVFSILPSSLNPSGTIFWLGIAGLCLVLAGREFGLFKFGIPQCRRQTPKIWRDLMSPVKTAWWWGIDLGSGITTLIRFSVYWILILIILSHGQVAYGALLLGLFALTRSLAVVIPPFMLSLRQDYLETMESLMVNFPQKLHIYHGLGLVSLAVALILFRVVLG